MNILLCPDKFKGSLSAQGVCHALQTGLENVNDRLNIKSIPMADGGDGSIDILKSVVQLTPLTVKTSDPLNRALDSIYYHSTDTAYIELASASGITLLAKSELNPLKTTTFGTGLMIKDALHRGFKKIFLFIGGSATNDGGIGIAGALGFSFLDKEGVVLKPIGENLKEIHKIENRSPHEFKDIEICVLTDVTNPLYGKNGAAYVYAAQKGASLEDIIILDEGLRNYASIIKPTYGTQVSELPGMGAAGGVGASLVGLLNAKLMNGFQMIAQATKLEEAIKQADLVITGEGKIDRTSFQGKVVGNVMDLCKKYNVPCGIVCGSLEDTLDTPVQLQFSKSVISKAKTFEDAMQNSKKFLEDIGKEIGLEVF